LVIKYGVNFWRSTIDVLRTFWVWIYLGENGRKWGYPGIEIFYDQMIHIYY
jgi:hypothetical protein